jgi:hypothetical protein
VRFTSDYRSEKLTTATVQFDVLPDRPLPVDNPYRFLSRAKEAGLWPAVARSSVGFAKEEQQQQQQ